MAATSRAAGASPWARRAGSSRVIQGGGFGSLSRRYGTAAGNMLEAEVVLASGEIVTANAVQHPDLF